MHCQHRRRLHSIIVRRRFDILCNIVVLNFDLSVRKWGITRLRGLFIAMQACSSYELPFWNYEPELNGQTDGQTDITIP